MSDERERAWTRGHITATRAMLGHVLRELAAMGEEINPEAAILELAEARLTLRGLCEKHGDPNWTERLRLSDVIEKYLVRPMLERAEETEDDE